MLKDIKFIFLLIGLILLIGCDSGRYLSKEDHQEKMIDQLERVKHLISQIRGHGVTEDKRLELEFFFYTNDEKKAENLAKDLLSLDYRVEYRKAVESDNEYVVTGWSDKIQFKESMIEDWTIMMCKLGYKYDCLFDGWGTYPDQE